MTAPQIPTLPIPPPLRGADPNKRFAYDTVTRRLPRIVQRTLEETDFDPEAVARLEALLAEIPQGPVSLLRDATAPDTAEWIEYVAPHLDKSWLEAPWFFVENYLYRRILEATGYFLAGAGRRLDPFAPHKQKSLRDAWPVLKEMVEQADQWRQGGWQEGAFEKMLLNSLWGNQGDLSMWPGGAGEGPSRPEGEAAGAQILVNQIEEAADHLAAARMEGPVRVDFMLDNVALELVSDLLLADFLLHGSRADRVLLHVKAHPTFISDVTAEDVEETVVALAMAGSETMGRLGNRLRLYLEGGRIEVHRNRFWTSPLEGWKMPPPLRKQLSQSQLVISKGDMNYRRLLGDRHWPYTTSFAEIAGYFPAPLLALRMLKSEVAAGLDPGQVALLEEKAPGWEITGTWGLIQFVDS